MKHSQLNTSGSTPSFILSSTLSPTADSAANSAVGSTVNSNAGFSVGTNSSTSANPITGSAASASADDSWRSVLSSSSGPNTGSAASTSPDPIASLVSNPSACSAASSSVYCSSNPSLNSSPSSSPEDAIFLCRNSENSHVTPGACRQNQGTIVHSPEKLRLKPLSRSRTNLRIWIACILLFVFLMLMASLFVLSDTRNIDIFAFSDIPLFFSSNEGSKESTVVEFISRLSFCYGLS